MPRTSTRNHFWAIGRSAAIRNRSVISWSKPYSSTRVVAGDPAPQEGQEAGQLGLPVVAEHLGGAPCWNAASQSAAGIPPSASGRRSWCGGRGSASAGGSAALRRRRLRLRLRLRLGRRRRVPAPARLADFGRGRLGRRATAARLRAADDGWRAGAAAGAAAGADRDDLGVTHGRLPPTARHGRGAGSGSRSARRPAPARCGRRSGAAAGEVGERLGGRVRRLEAEHRCASGWCRRRGRRSGTRVCSGEKSATPGRAEHRADAADRERRQRDGRPLRGGAAAWESIRRPSPATLKVPATSVSDGVPEHGEQVAARAGTAAAASWPSTVGMTGSRKYDVSGLVTCGPITLAARSSVTADVGAAAGEPAHVALDLGDVLGVARSAAARRGSMSSVNIAGSRLLAPYTVVVDFTTRCSQTGRLLARRQELHRPDDVELFHRVATPGTAGGRDHAHVDDGVDVLLDDDLRDDRVADVGAHERDVADVAARRHGVDADDPGDSGVGRGSARELPTEVARDPGDEDDPAGAAHTANEPRGLLAELATLDARLLQQLAVLLLGHALAPLLDDRTHRETFQQP